MNDKCLFCPNCGAEWSQEGKFACGSFSYTEPPEFMHLSNLCKERADNDRLRALLEKAKDVELMR